MKLEGMQTRMNDKEINKKSSVNNGDISPGEAYPNTDCEWKELKTNMSF